MKKLLLILLVLSGIIAIGQNPVITKALGPELIINGTFESASGWDIIGESEINNGSGRVYSSAGSYSAIRQLNVIEVGRKYILNFDLTVLTIGGVNISDGTTLIIGVTAVGSYSTIFTATNTSITMARSTGVTDLRVDNVSVKEYRGVNLININGKILGSNNPAYDTDGWLPDTIFVAENVDIKIYNDDVFYTSLPDTNKYAFYWDSTIGTQDTKGFIYHGETLGNYECTAYCRYNDRLIDSASTIITTVSNVALQDTILAIGNSLTAQGWAYQMDEIIALSTGTLLPIGTKTIGGYEHEGISGWAFKTFIEAGSPFYFTGSVDFSQYLATNGLPTPTIVRVYLGINDAGSSLSLDDIMLNADTLMNALIADIPNALKIVCLATSAENTGQGWINNYGDLSTRERYMTRLRDLRVRLYDKYGNKSYDANVVTDYAGMIIDRNNGYPKTDGIHNNGVHPNQSGHEEIATSLYNTINYYN